MMYRVTVAPTVSLAAAEPAPTVTFGAEVENVEWAREANTITEAVVSATITDRLAAQVARVAPITSTMSIYRRNRLVWRGPVMLPEFRRTTVTLVAWGPAFWLSARLATVKRDGTVNLAGGADALVAEALEGRSPGVTWTAPLVSSHSTSLAVDPAARSTVLDAVNELTAAGLTLVEVNGTIVVGDPPLAANGRPYRLGHLSNRHFTGDLPVSVRGDLAASDVWMVGDDGTIGFAAAEGVPAHLRVERVVRRRGTDRGALQRLAERYVAEHWPAPVVVDSARAQIDLDLVDLETLVPSARGTLTYQRPGTPTVNAAPVRCSALSVAYSGGVETATVALVPLIGDET